MERTSLSFAWLCLGRQLRAGHYITATTIAWIDDVRGGGFKALNRALLMILKVRNAVIRYEASLPPIMISSGWLYFLISLCIPGELSLYAVSLQLRRPSRDTESVPIAQVVYLKPGPQHPQPL